MKFDFILLLISCVHASIPNNILKIRSTRSHPQYIFSKTIRIKCNITGDPIPLIRWYYSKSIRDSYLLLESEEYLIVNSDGVINLPNNGKHKAERGETYFCQATNLVGTIRSPKFTLFKVSNVASVRLTYERKPISQYSKGIMGCVLENEIYHFYKLDHWVVIENGKSVIVRKTRGRFSVFRTPRTAPQLHVRNVTQYDKDHLKARCVLRHRYNNTLYYNPNQWNKFDSSWTKHNVKIDHCGVTNITVYENEPVELPVCYGGNVNIREMGWYYNPTTYDQSPVLIGQEGFTKYSYPTAQGRIFDNLIIHHVKRNDSGRYFVKNRKTGEITNPPIQLNVQERINVTIWDNRLAATPGDSVSLGCTVHGYPISSIYWLHNGKFLKRENKLNSNSYRLIISNVCLKKIGVYQCVSEWRDKNRILRSSAQASAEVFLKSMKPILKSQTPKLARPTSPYSTVTLQNEKSSVNFSCEFAGVPKPNITWYLDDRMIPITSALEVGENRNDRNNLYIVKSNIGIHLARLTSISDVWKFGGLYKAVASNGHGESQCYTMVFVPNVFEIRDVVKKDFHKGEPITLSCNVISYAEPDQIRWYKIKNGKEIRLPETGGESLTFNKRVLTIVGAKKFTRTGGRFKCEAGIDPMKRKSKVFNITIVRKPKVSFNIKPKVFVDMKLEKLAALHCRPEGSTDKPWYAWWTIKFSRYPKPPNGDPEILLKPNPSSIVPSLSIQYYSVNDYKTTKLPKGVPSFLRKYSNAYSKITIIYNDTFDEAVLTCHVQNNAGVDSKSSTIHIINPQFEIEPKSLLTVTVGDSFKVDCVPKKTSLKTITGWKYSYKIADRSSSNLPPTNNTLPVLSVKQARTTKHRLYQLSNGTLVVKNITEFDPVQFTCVVRVDPDTNKPSTISKVTKITVNVPARITLEDQIDLRRNEPGVINCSVHGDTSNLTIEWKKPMYIMDTKTSQYSKGKNTVKSLIFHRVDDSYGGKYRCYAQNSYNKQIQIRETTVSIVDIPEEVTTIRGGERQARSLVLIWETPSNTGNKPILGYYVKYRPVNDQYNDDNDNKWTIQEAKTTRITIKGLRPNTRYRIGIWPYNSIGPGNKKILKETFLTKEAAPEGKVQNFKVVAESSTTIRLAWSPPKKSLQNGQLKDYKVCYRQTSTKNNTRTYKTKEKCVTVPYKPSESKKLFTDLPKFTEFEFRVSARNKLGLGPVIAKTLRTKPDLPETEPQHVKCQVGSSQMRGTTLDIQWQAPPAHSINGVIQNYQLEFYPSDSGSPLITRTFYNTRANLDNLTPYTKYSIQVRVVNKKGRGPLSHPVECLTGQAPPSSPRGAKASIDDQKKCLYVTWLSPAHPNGKINQYCFEWPNQKDICYNTDLGIANDIPSPYSDRPFFFKKLCDNEFNQLPTVLKIKARNQYFGEPLSVKVEKPSFIVLSVPRNITIFEGKNVTLDCSVNEDIRMHGQVRWVLPRGEERFPKDDVENSIILSPLLSGYYKCLLKNRLLVMHHVTVQSIQKRRPFKPILVYQNSDSRSIFVKWRSQAIKNTLKSYSQSDIPPLIDHYWVRLTHKGGRINRTKKVPVKFPVVNMTGLTCGVDYQVSITATSNYGSSDSLILHIRTTGSIVQFPDKFHVEQYPYALCFPLYQFLPGNDCPASYFNVTLIPANQGKSSSNHYSNITQSFNAANLMPNECQNITNLNAATNYRYYVEAVNAAGVQPMKGIVQTNIPLRKSDRATATPITYDHTSTRISSTTLIIIGVFIAVFLPALIICVICYVKRNKSAEHIKSSMVIDNKLQPKPPVPLYSSLPESKRRKLPSPPRENTPPNNQIPISSGANNMNIQQSSAATILPPPNNNQEDLDTVQPYAVYMSHQSASPGFPRHMGASTHSDGVQSKMPFNHQSLPPQSMSNQHHSGMSGMRLPPSVNNNPPSQHPNNNNMNNIINNNPVSNMVPNSMNNNGIGGAYMSGGSQAHSYQYPEHPTPHSHLMRTMPTNNNRVYNRGYSTGGPGTKVGMLDPNSVNPITDSEHYRPSSSTTASSAKDELSRILSDTYTNNFSTIQRGPTAATTTANQQQRMMTSEPNTIVPNYASDSVDLGDSMGGSSGPDIGNNDFGAPGGGGGTIGRQPGVPSDDASALLLPSYQPPSVDDSVSGGEHPVTFTNELPSQNRIVRPITTRHSNNQQQFIQPLINSNNHNMDTVNEEENDSIRFTNDFVVV